MTDAAKQGRSEHWAAMWGQGLPRGAAFDTGDACVALSAWLQAHPAPGGGARALVPGCGRGYDTGALAAAGYNAVGLDLAPPAIDEAKKFFAELPADHPLAASKERVELVAGDFFEANLGGQFDLIFDCTFLCALHPEAREKWADRTISLLKPGGRLASLVFPICDKEGGPPYALLPDAVKGLIEPRGLTILEEQNPVPEELRHMPKNPFGAQTAFIVFQKPQ